MFAACHYSINRTKVELKHWNQTNTFAPDFTINRTKVELKHWNQTNTFAPDFTINRTKVELKHIRAVPVVGLFGLSIVPKWN